MVYFTEDDVRKGIETRLNKSLFDIEWTVIRPFLISEGGAIHLEDEDLDDYMLPIKESLRNFRRVMSNTEKQVFAIARTHSERNGNEIYNDSILLCELWREELRSNSAVEHVLSEVALSREDLGLGMPVPLNSLRKRLLELGATNKPPGNPLPYPIRREILTEDMRQVVKEGNEYVTQQARELNTHIAGLLRAGRSTDEINEVRENWLLELEEKVTTLIEKKMEQANSSAWFYAFTPIYFWDIKYLFVPRQEAHKFRPVFESLTTISLVVQCHPALGLACLICDLPLFPPHIPKLEIVRDGKNIQLFANSPYVSPKAIARQFREVRRYGIRDTKEAQGIWPRPRRPKRKTLALFKHCSKSAKIGWGRLREEWNEKHHDWQYGSNKQMQLAYYKAKARIKRE